MLRDVDCNTYKIGRLDSLSMYPLSLDGVRPVFCLPVIRLGNEQTGKHVLRHISVDPDIVVISRSYAGGIDLDTWEDKEHKEYHHHISLFALPDNHDTEQAIEKVFSDVPSDEEDAVLQQIHALLPTCVISSDDLEFRIGKEPVFYLKPGYLIMNNENGGFDIVDYDAADWDKLNASSHINLTDRPYHFERMTEEEISYQVGDNQWRVVKLRMISGINFEDLEFDIINAKIKPLIERMKKGENVAVELRQIVNPYYRLELKED